MNRHALLIAALLLAAQPLQAAETPENIAKAVAAPERSAKDRERDAIDKPAELLAFAGVKPGMKVADFFGGGGYWSELLSRAVGPTGSVTLVNNPGYYFFSRDGLKERFADGRLKDIKQRVVETGNLDLGSGAVRPDRHLHGLPRPLLGRRIERLAEDRRRRRAATS